MPECYLCGRYIVPGEGHRRTVQTGTSTRVYMTKRGGASYGSRSGLRTLCYKCATIKDRYGEGSALRGTAYFIGWLVSVYAGWQIIMLGHGIVTVLIGLSFIFGLPLAIVKVIHDNQRLQAIYDEVEGAEGVTVQPWPSSQANPAEPADDAYRYGEDAEAWAVRVLGGYVDENNRHVFAFFADKSPPRPGQSVDEWVRSWPTDDLPLDSERENAFDAATYRKGETVGAWAKRAAAAIATVSDREAEEMEGWLVDMAKYVKPLPGEHPKEYSTRAKSRFALIDQTLDPRSAESAKKRGEGLKEWLQRVAPLCLEIEDGDCLDDIISKYVIAARSAPPMPDESIWHWLTRVQPLAEQARIGN